MVDTVVVEQEVHPSAAVCWPAIIAGGFVAIAFTLMLLALAAGLGFSVVSPWRGAPDVTTAKAATVGGIFMAVTAVMASALGGYVAGRLRSRWQAAPDEVYFRDTAHGLLAWAFATVIGVLILGSAATIFSGGVAAGAGQAMQRADYVDPFLDRLFRPDYAALTGGTGQRAAGVFAAGRDLAVDRDVARRVMASMVRGDVVANDRQYLAQMVVARTGVDAAEADRRIAATETDIRAAADKARRIGMHLAFWSVAAMLLGALAACLAALEGGALRDGRRWSL